MHMEDQKIREDARKIMDAALHAALPDTAVEKALAEMPDASGRLILVAPGKAAWQMAAAAYRILGKESTTASSSPNTATPWAPSAI